MLTNIFLQSDCTHLLFVDDDIDFAAEDIFAMVAAMAERPKCGILGAPVPRRMVNWTQVARAVDRGLARGDPTELARYTGDRSEEHTSELQSLMRISYAVLCLKKKTHK